MKKAIKLTSGHMSDLTYNCNDLQPDFRSQLGLKVENYLHDYSLKQLYYKRTSLNYILRSRFNFGKRQLKEIIQQPSSICEKLSSRRRLQSIGHKYRLKLQESRFWLDVKKRRFLSGDGIVTLILLNFIILY